MEHKRDKSDSEYQMMTWLQGKLPVPEIVSFYTDRNNNYLLMTQLKGKVACDSTIMVDGENMARLMAKGLRRIWRVDIENCPRKINLDYKLDRALYRIKNNLIDIDDAEIGTFGSNGFANPMELYEYLRDNRSEEEEILIHRDYCMPNVFFEELGIEPDEEKIQYYILLDEPF